MTNQVKVDAQYATAASAQKPQKPVKKTKIASLDRRKARAGWIFVLPFVIGFVIPIHIPGLKGIAYTFVRAAIKLLLIPVIMGIGYELLKFAGRHDNILTRIISAPGMWLQRITVREPTDDMIECAIKAFVAVIPEGERENEPQAEQKNNEA